VCLSALAAQLRKIKEQILGFDRMIAAWHRSSETSRRLDDCPGVGPALATALVASVADPKAFRSGRNFSAWIGLVPKQHSSGGKGRLGSISKQGDRYLRSLFVAGALAVIRYAKIHGTKHRPWLAALLARRRNAISIVEIVSAWSFRELELSSGASMVSISSMFVSMAPILAGEDRVLWGRQILAKRRCCGQHANRQQTGGHGPLQDARDTEVKTLDANP
jgi:hypothetical protein